MKAFRKDSDWSEIDGEVCRVLEFTPLKAMVVNKKVESADLSIPYARVVFECSKLDGKATGYITHKIDFAMLHAACVELADVPDVHAEVGREPKTGKPETEVWMVWTTKRYKLLVGTVKLFMPKLTVSLYPKGAYDLITHRERLLDLKSDEVLDKTTPFVTWTPDVMTQ